MHRGVPLPTNRVRGRLRLAAGFVAFLSLTAQGASAQTIHGTVVDDESGEPLPDVRVRLMTVDTMPRSSVVTDARGAFVLDAELGEYRLEAQRLGYGTVLSQVFAVTTVDTVRVTFHLSAQAVVLDPLVVGVPRVQGQDLFERRRALGEGVFLGPELVDSLRPSIHAGEIFGHAEAVRVRWTWGRTESGRAGPIPAISTYKGKFGCMHYVVDRTLVPDPWFEASLNEWAVAPLSEVTPENLVAVEVYRDWSEVPPDLERQLLIRNGQERAKLMKLRRLECGVAVIWTDRGW